MSDRIKITVDGVAHYFPVQQVTWKPVRVDEPDGSFYWVVKVMIGGAEPFTADPGSFELMTNQAAINETNNQTGN